MRTVGMRLENLTEEVLRRVIELYDETVGGHGLRYLNPDLLRSAKEKLSYRHPVE